MTFQSFGFWVLLFFSVTTAVSPCSRGFPFGIWGLECIRAGGDTSLRYHEPDAWPGSPSSCPRSVGRRVAARRRRLQSAAGSAGGGADPGAGRERGGRGHRRERGTGTDGAFRQ